MSQRLETKNVPVFILCGGLGTRLKEETEFRPKPMVPIGEHPILWHVMQKYARHGFRRFVLCLGFKADVVKDYFSNFHLHNNDCTIALKSNKVTVHESRVDLDWEVTLAFTGEKNMTGSRVAEFAEKPDLEGHWINGGFFFFHRDFLKQLPEDEACVLERDPLVQLARAGQLTIHKHQGFWGCMDTQRDRDHLTQLAESGHAPWLK
jgi:glucose-1-phosphate cytidylyltransferase